jgi:hypothetical protein
MVMLMTTCFATRLLAVGLLIFLSPLSVTQANDDFWDPTFGTQGMNNKVFAITLDGEDVYVGGEFTMAGALDVGRVAKWNGSSWSDVGGGVGEPDSYHDVRALLFHEGVLYVGGNYQGAGNTGAINIARWNGSQWRMMGLLNGPVRDLEVFQGDIYACGEFDKSHNTVLNGIARWDGSSWQPMDAGLRVESDAGYGTSMDANDTHLYVGGHFTKAGHTFAIRTAKWDGTAWSTGTESVRNGFVQAILVVGADVYVGGTFSFSGLSNIARWNGTWDDLDGGANLHVIALSEFGGEIYAAGTFRFMGGVTVNHVAKWDGAAWSAFGRGLDGGVLGAYAIAAKSDTEFWVGGVFDKAGGKDSYYIAHWQEDPSVPVESKRWGGIKSKYREK